MSSNKPMKVELSFHASKLKNVERGRGTFDSSVVRWAATVRMTAAADEMQCNAGTPLA
jgi:hypothetical protein